MTNENLVLDAQEEQAPEEKAVKRRRPPFKIQVTAAEIIAELEELTEKVEELSIALEELEEGTTAHNLIKQAYDVEAEKLEAASTRIYHA